MSYNNFELTGFIGGDDASYYGNTTKVGNPFSGGTQSGRYMGPSTGDNEWYLRPPENGGPMQPYTGVDVIGGDFQGPPSVGPPPFRENDASLNGAHHSPFNVRIHDLPSQFATLPPYNVPGPPLAPTLQWPYYRAPNYPDGLDAYGAGPSTRPAPRIPPYSPPEEAYGCGSQNTIPDPNPFRLSSVPLTAPNTSASLSLLGPSSSGPQRTTKRAKGKRMYDPLKSSPKNMGADRGECEDGWSGALIRFQKCLAGLCFDSKLYEVLSFETVLAAGTSEFVKDDLKRSPLKDNKAGDGKRPRDVEDYLTGILREINPTGASEADRSRDIRMRWAFYAKVADELEARLLPVNTESALRQPSSGATQVGKGARLEQTEQRVEKNKKEKSKRDKERSELERIGYFFKAAGPRKCWTRAELLSFVVAYFLYGSGIFSPGFVSDAPA